MDATAVVIGLVGVILGGGGIGALIPVLRLREDKGNVIAVGSEAAVQSLTIALDRSDKRVSDLEAENEALKATIAQLRVDVDIAKASVNELSRKIEELAKGTK